MVNWNGIVMAALLTGALVAVPGTVMARTAGSESAKDQQVVGDYKLSMDVLQRIAKANKSAAASGGNPAKQRLTKQKAELAALEAKDDPTAAEQQRMMVLADEIARRVDATPALAAAVKSVGLSSREYATAILALMEASIAHAFIKQGLAKQAPPGVSKHNLEFVRANEQQIVALDILAKDDH
jgi:hypothetical protein